MAATITTTTIIATAVSSFGGGYGVACSETVATAAAIATVSFRDVFSTSLETASMAPALPCFHPPFTTVSPQAMPSRTIETVPPLPPFHPFPVNSITAANKRTTIKNARSEGSKRSKRILPEARPGRKRKKGKMPMTTEESVLPQASPSRTLEEGDEDGKEIEKEKSGENEEKQKTEKEEDDKATEGFNYIMKFHTKSQQKGMLAFAPTVDWQESPINLKYRQIWTSSSSSSVIPTSLPVVDEKLRPPPTDRSKQFQVLEIMNNHSSSSSSSSNSSPKADYPDSPIGLEPEPDDEEEEGATLDILQRCTNALS